MTLEDAYIVGKKYGFTFNGIGPSFSFINNQVGICLNLLDHKYGYLKRNFTFASVAELDNFLKKYSFYLRNRERENIYLSLDDYEKENPKILYSFEEVREKKRKIDEQNKTILKNDIVSFFNNYFMKIEQLINNINLRFQKEQDYHNKLNYYKRILHQVYNKPYKEIITKLDQSIKNDIINKILHYKNQKQQEIENMNIQLLSLKDIEDFYKNLVIDFQTLLIDEKIIKVLYDNNQYDNYLKLLDQMINYLLYNQTLTENTQSELQMLKESANITDFYDKFKIDYLNKIKTAFSKLDTNNVLTFNVNMFGAKPIVYVQYIESEDNIVDLNKVLPYYEKLNDENKRAIMLLYSPLKPILIYIIEQAYKKNTSFNFERKEFKNIYFDINKALSLSENLVFKLKYFRDVKLENYDLFIKSLVKIAKTICSSYVKLPFDLKIYSLNYNDCFITGSYNVIQNGDDIIRIIDVKADSYIIYCPIKIKINRNKLLELTKNNGVIYFPSFNNLCTENDIETQVNIYEEGYNVINVAGDNLLVVTNFALQNKIYFADSIMTGKI